MASTEAPRPQIALFGGDAQTVESLAGADAVDWLLCRRGEDRRYEFARAGQLVSRLDLAAPLFDLPDLVAILGIGDRDGMATLAAGWQALLPSVGVAVEWLEDPAPLAIMARALHHVARHLTLQRKYDGEIALQLATYRREFERMQYGFTMLEGYVATIDPARLRGVFDYPRSSASFDLAAGADAIEQVLPVNSLGVACVSLSLGAASGRLVPHLRVTLSARETGATIAAWTLDPARIAGEWTQLPLERAIDEPALTLVLAIAPPQGDGWSVRLGAPHPYSEFCARTGGGASLGAPLALRVQTTLPGTRVAATTAPVRADGASRPDAVLLTEADYETVAEVFAPPGADSGSFAHYNRELGFIQVHPRGDGVATIARVSVSPPARAWRLSAQICLEHEQANPTLFGLFVQSGADGDTDLPDVTALADGVEGFSGWTSLSAMQRGSLSLVLPVTTRRGLEIFLMTRQDGRPEYAWARFSQVRLHLLPTD